LNGWPPFEHESIRHSHRLNSGKSLGTGRCGSVHLNRVQTGRSPFELVNKYYLGLLL